jgi:hypothetical protein
LITYLLLNTINFARSGICLSEVDKHLKLDKLLGTIYLSTESRPIKVANTAPRKTMRAIKVAIETAKTGKVTAVVAVMSIFSEKICKLQSGNCKNEKPSCQKAKKY